MNDRQRITSITTWIAALVAIAVTFFLPLGYFAVSYQYLVGSLDTKAEMTSHLVTDLINTNPELWHYEKIRLEELLARRMRDNQNPKETLLVLDRHNRLIAESATVLKPPLITRRFDLLDSGVTIGTLEIRTSLYPILFRCGLAALLGLSCGVVIFVTLRVLPMRAVVQAEKSLRESKQELTDKVALLEAALDNVKQLEGIIPICMYCKKIRDDQDSWQQLEGYITEHSEAFFSHGICPECFQKVSSEELKKLANLTPR